MKELYTFEKLVQWGNYIYIVVALNPKEALELINAISTVKIEREHLKYRAILKGNDRNEVVYIHEYDIHQIVKVKNFQK